MNYSIPNVWTSYSSLKGSTAPSGPFYLINIAEDIESVIEIVVSDSEPTLLTSGRPVPSDGKEYLIPNEGKEVWFRYFRNAGDTAPPLYTTRAYISEDSILGSNSFSVESLITSPIQSVGRLSVDSQQTSFEDNKQFRYFDRLSNISNNDQVVYKIFSANPLAVLQRDLALYSGGRELLIYPLTENIVFTGTLEDSGRIVPVNSHLNSSITTHPITGSTIQRAVGSGIFSTTDLPISGSLVVTNNQGNAQSSAFTADGLRAGISGGTTSYIVLNSVGGNDSSNGQLTLTYEEEF